MNIFGVVGLIISISSFILAIYTFVNKERLLHFIWGLFSLAVSLWGFGIFKFSTTIKINDAIFWWRIAEVGVIFIPIFLTHFTYEFLNRSKNIFIFSLYGLAAIFVFFDIFTNYLFGELRFVFKQFYYITPTPIYTLLVIIFLMLAIYNIFILYKEYRKREGLVKHQIKYLTIAFIIGFSGGATSFLPVYGIDIYPVFNLTIFFSALIVVYSIFRHKFLDIKTLATQLLVFSTWFFLFGRIFLAKNLEDKIIDTILLGFVIIFGYLIIRSVLKEVKTREEMEKLAGALEMANVRLKALDKEKSDFVTITSHQLRAPLTAIKGYTSMIIEGSYGPVSEKVREILDRVFQSSNRLVYFVGDLLNLSRIERGKMVYDFKKVDFRDLVKGVFEDFLAINKKENKGFEMSFEAEKVGDYGVNADFEKIRQVVYNFMDNAMKYNKAGGFVKVFLSKDAGAKKVVLKVQDNGMGMSKESLAKIFEKFARGEGSALKHTEGTGLGLYVAKEVVKAHGGDIWAESEGLEKGSAFYMRLPVKEV